MMFWNKNKKEKKKGAGLSEGLTRTRKGIFGKINDLLRGAHKLDDDFLDQLEEILISSDVGVKTTMEIVEELREAAIKEKSFSSEKISSLIKEQISLILSKALDGEERKSGKPHVILIIGVNGTGKTTTIGKLANYFALEGSKVMMAAADTFRAAAIEQLEIWSQRSGAELIKHKAQADPAAVVFDAISAAKARNVDYLIIDTAGRLHTKSNLMEELQKITRIVSREVPGAPHDVLLVLDATTGQNGLVQAQEFTKSSPINGLVLTKLDGTAKGGIVVAITKEMNLPIRFVGTGEAIEDIVEFDPDEFVNGLFQEVSLG